MPIKRHAPGTDPAVTRWDGGLTWIAHPDEAMCRASHAIAVGPDGRLADGDAEPDAVDIWVVEPVDARGLDDRLADLGRVAGVVVLTGFHRRDAATVARRHGVSVFLPAPLAGLAPKLDAPVEVFERTLPGTRFEVVPLEVWRVWHEAALYDAASGTLVATDSLVTSPAGTAPDERLAVGPYLRLFPPRAALSGLAVERVLVGHGLPVLEGAETALETALAGAVRRFPAYLAANPGYFLRAWVVALRR